MSFFIRYFDNMKLKVQITKVVKLEGQSFSVTTSNQAVAHSSYKGSGVIKRKQSDGKRERTQITLDRIEQTFARTLATARKLERIEQIETFKTERSTKQKQDRLAHRLNKRK